MSPTCPVLPRELSLLPGPGRASVLASQQLLTVPCSTSSLPSSAFFSPAAIRQSVWALPDKPTAAALKCHLVDAEMHVTMSHWVPHSPTRLWQNPEAGTQGTRSDLAPAWGSSCALGVPAPQPPPMPPCPQEMHLGSDLCFQEIPFSSSRTKSGLENYRKNWSQWIDEDRNYSCCKGFCQNPSNGSKATFCPTELAAALCCNSVIDSKGRSPGACLVHHI